jgi:hypothetical protein
MTYIRPPRVCAWGVHTAALISWGYFRLNCSAQEFVAAIGAWAGRCLVNSLTVSNPAGRHIVNITSCEVHLDIVLRNTRIRLLCSSNTTEEVLGQEGYPTFSTLNFNFFHAEQDAGEAAAVEEASRESLAQCRGASVSCRELVLQEASIGTKGLGQYLTSLVTDVGTSPRWLPVTHLFGWRPAHTFTVQTSDAPIFNSNISVRLEGGGGSGAGFQVYCGETLVLTAGGGGGGGMEGRPTRRRVGRQADFSVGGGGGGGVQFRYPLDAHAEVSFVGSPAMSDWVNVGGGSGCGTCDAGGEELCDESAERLLCGQKMDEDSITDRMQSARFKESLQWWRSQGGNMRIVGGGGGGGGTAECCDTYAIGYGFSFELYVYTLSPPSPPAPAPAPQPQPQHSGGRYDQSYH